MEQAAELNGVKPHELTFSEFAEAVRPSGAVNKLQQLGRAKEVRSYSVYMNGDVAEALPESAKHQEYSDTVLHAITERVGLDPERFRDTLKVAELLATKEAWMTAVLEASTTRGHDGQATILAPAVVEDYERLTDGFSHPWLQDQLLAQQTQGKNLQPALQAAETTLGMAVSEQVPGEVNRGRIVSQNSDFTVQALGDGKVVAHENRRLEVVPTLDQDVTVTYYKGNGQVFDNNKELRVSEPYIDPKTQDLAVAVHGSDNQVKQVVLFNGIASFAKFVEEQGIDAGMTQQAIDLRIANPKKIVQVETPDRKPLTGMYIDPATNGLAFDYAERGARNTIVFGSAKAVTFYAEAFGITPAGIEQARALEASQQEQGRLADRQLAANEVRPTGPNRMLDGARIAAAQRYPGDRDRQAEFIRKIGERLESDERTQSAESNKLRDGQDIER